MNWKKLFAIHILERGYDYYCDDAVENMEILDDIIREWKVKYRNRPAMMDEVRKL